MSLRAKCVRCRQSLGVLADEMPTIEEGCPTCAARLRRWADAHLTPTRRGKIEQQGGYLFCNSCRERLFGDCPECRTEEVRELERLYRLPSA
jgi:hypothetical protein